MSKKINNIACYKVIRTIKKRKIEQIKEGGELGGLHFIIGWSLKRKRSRKSLEGSERVGQAGYLRKNYSKDREHPGQKSLVRNTTGCVRGTAKIPV